MCHSRLDRPRTGCQATRYATGICAEILTEQGTTAFSGCIELAKGACLAFFGTVDLHRIYAREPSAVLIAKLVAKDAAIWIAQSLPATAERACH